MGRSSTAERPRSRLPRGDSDGRGTVTQVIYLFINTVFCRLCADHYFGRNKQPIHTSYNILATCWLCCTRLLQQLPRMLGSANSSLPLFSQGQDWWFWPGMASLYTSKSLPIIKISDNSIALKIAGKVSQDWRPLTVKVEWCSLFQSRCQVRPEDATSLCAPTSLSWRPSRDSRAGSRTC